MKIQTASLSHQGGRSSNDDAVRILERGDKLCVFVGDGLGSYAGGALASQAAAEACLQAAHRGSLLDDSRLQQTAADAQEAVLALQAAQGGRMMTTLVLLGIEAGHARWMHIGDSRLYHFQNGRLMKQTMDHSVSQVAVLMGQITAAEIRHHEDRNRILRAVGGENAKPDIAPMITVGPDDAFLLCTDGFWEYVLEEEMEQTLRAAADPTDWLARMEQILRQRVPDNNDNYTAAAVICRRRGA